MKGKVKKRYVIGIDVGGTKINAGLILQERGKKGKNIVKKIKLKTHAEKGKNFVISRISGIIPLLLEGIAKKNIAGIGMGMPGPTDSKKGIVLLTPNLSGWGNVPIKTIIQKKFKVNAKIDNDTNCIALAESKFFHCKNLICLTLGTGVGGGIIINGKIYHGAGTAGELGHMVIDVTGPRCSCGNNGCLEEFVSARGIRRIAKKIYKPLGPKELQLGAERGNKKAIKVYEEVGKYLGIGLANLVNIFNPEMIVIGGSISKAAGLILKPAIKEMRKRAFRVSVEDVKVVASQLGEDAGILGAAALLNE